ncbi:MAG: nucleoside triphosphate pyrophosphohydrolase [Planctomycetes bacterium]|nr:nucleoside triphosphate pyrophosphohydrolase [Planctomycetota bacterium]
MADDPCDRPPADLPGIRHLLATIARLRAPDGCPWDREQTTASMAPHLVEEAFEAADALRRGDDAAAREELGDVLVNVAMIGQIAGERGAFAVDAVAAAAATKLVRRHPHVFGDQKVDGAEQAYRNWERTKRAEAGDGRRGALAGVPVALPALLRAFRVGEKAARAGFDWPDRRGPRGKLDEELGELDAAIAGGEAAAIAEELGDALFSLCNLARHLGVNPEVALAATTDKFQQRFAAIEAEFGYDLGGRSLAELDAAWERAKAASRAGGSGG